MGSHIQSYITKAKIPMAECSKGHVWRVRVGFESVGLLCRPYFDETEMLLLRISSDSKLVELTEPGQGQDDVI